MSTIKTTNITHGSNSGTANLALTSAGNVTVGADLIATKQNGCQRIILEQFYTPCDGSVIALQDGNHTILNTTAKQGSTTSEVLMNGSEISYTPPTGTTQVIYEYSFQIGHEDSDPILNYWLYVDSSAVAYSASTTRGHYYHCNRVFFKWALNIGGTASTNTGRQASWGSAKTLKMMFRSLALGTYGGDIHEAENFGPLSSADVFAQPCLGITAIG